MLDDEDMWDNECVWCGKRIGFLDEEIPSDYAHLVCSLNNKYACMSCYDKHGSKAKRCVCEEDYTKTCQKCVRELLKMTVAIVMTGWKKKDMSEKWWFNKDCVYMVMQQFFTNTYNDIDGYNDSFKKRPSSTPQECVYRLSDIKINLSPPEPEKVNDRWD